MALFSPCTVNSPFDGTLYNANMVRAENSFADLGPYVISGLAVTIGAGLSVNVASGTASIGGRVTATSMAIAGLTDNTTNHLYILNTGAGTSNTSGTAPANSAKLGTCVTLAGVVSTVNMGRSSGRQQFIQPQSLVHGGLALGVTSAGHPRSVNLANWANTAGEGVEVSGILPAGAIGGSLEAAIVTPPLAAALTALNVTTATLADSSLGGLFLNAPDVAASKLQGWYKTLAAGSYTWIVRLTGSLLSSSTFVSYGLFLRDSAGGKIMGFEQGYFSGTTNITVIEYSDANTRFANAYNTAFNAAAFNWLKIRDDGAVNRIYSVSRNGADWLDLYTEARTNYLGVAPNQAGLYVSANGKATILNVQSWQGI